MSSAKKIRLDQAVAERGLADSRTKAAALIMAGQVKVGGKVVDKAGYFVNDDDKITVTAPPRYVSRGGDKLASVADRLGLNFKDKVMLDVGSSTGGFTDYALQNGARHVYAVDVGTGQLDWRLRNDSRVTVMERTDIRDVAELPEAIDIVTIDVSFISLRQILPAIAKLTDQETQIVAMAKPHFEADYVTASKHKGVIKNDTIRRQILRRVESFMKQGFKIEAKADSQVLGRKGNKERFYLLKPV
ncbi:MAG TPA: TlyA family RNA methyltransferase [Candidatus Saccharimonadales bacterium]|nr:TlyA family RNA methyltransferase [Candidatus Saccharimonadales bacterium]